MSYKRFFLSMLVLTVCLFLVSACGEQNSSNYDNGGSSGQSNSILGNSGGSGQGSSSTGNSGGSGQGDSSSGNSGNGTIVQNFKCTSGISNGVIVPPYPDALHITFLQATTTANFVQDEMTIQQSQSDPSTFTWTLRSTGQSVTLTVTNPSIGVYNWGVTVLSDTETLSMDPDTGQMQQATYWVAEVCDQWATDGTPFE